MRLAEGLGKRQETPGTAWKVLEGPAAVGPGRDLINVRQSKETIWWTCAIFQKKVQKFC